MEERPLTHRERELLRASIADLTADICGWLARYEKKTGRDLRLWQTNRGRAAHFRILARRHRENAAKEVGSSREKRITG